MMCSVKAPLQSGLQHVTVGQIQDAPVAENTFWASLLPKRLPWDAEQPSCICSAMASAVLGVPLRTQLIKSSISQALQRLEVVPGDISQPDCGIEHETQERLLPEVDFVLHAAASIQFTNHVHEDLRLSYLATESILKLSQQVSGVPHVWLLNQATASSSCPAFHKRLDLATADHVKPSQNIVHPCNLPRLPPSHLKICLSCP